MKNFLYEKNIQKVTHYGGGNFSILFFFQGCSNFEDITIIRWQQDETTLTAIRPSIISYIFPLEDTKTKKRNESFFSTKKLFPIRRYFGRKCSYTRIILEFLLLP
ncbi:hypothetical protein CEXT_155731 [Caerostris extrusa]|uniref:Uncharacterized protein n=1 Tax=Caerostris extrusa TaxID=172846 RepID=A0AAV4MQ23_CAEEX|nr:hypothetical protein CEXT_155731 [Caerostris extrusa]